MPTLDIETFDMESLVNELIYHDMTELMNQEIKTYQQPLLTGNHDHYHPWGNDFIGITRVNSDMLKPLTITRFRKWYQIRVPLEHEKCAAIENWIADNVERKDFVINRAKNFKHYKFREHSLALMCILAVA